MIKNKSNIIKCPKCGYEYLAAEIFFPDDIFGKPENITRDENNKIIYYNGDEPPREEHWTCDCCGTELLIKAEVELNVTVKHNTFDEDYSTPIYSNRVQLSEVMKEKIENKK